jgi:tetratricopeptide (TPR) repeat protein
MGDDAMHIALVLAAALTFQADDQLTVNAPSVDQVDVAYQELVEGKNAEAVAKLEASPLVEDGDPAALINLGTAYARLGRLDEARTCYKAARTSNDRYFLELADGQWVDSRRAASMASSALRRGEVLALR